MSFEDIKSIVLFAIAVYGAILSTLNWLSARRKDKPSVKVSFDTVTPVHGNKLGESFVKLTAANAGFRDVTVSSIFLGLPGKKALFSTAPDSFIIPDTRLPKKLNPGDTAEIYISYFDVATAMKSEGFKRKTSVTPTCQDSLGKLHVGELITVDPDEFLKVSGR